MAIVVVTTSPTTLDSGSSEFVTVTNTGTVDVTVARGSQSFVLRPTQGRVVYPEGASVTASVVSGSGQVTTAARAAQVTQAQQVTANTTAIAGLPGTYARLGRTFRGLRAVIFGDSYGAINYSVTGTPGTANSVLSYPARGPVTWANFWLNSRLDIVGYKGNTGEQTTQWLARYAADVAPLAPDLVIMGSAGINDMGNGRTPAQVMTTLRTMFDSNELLGATTVMWGPVPSGTAGTPQKQFIHEMASLLRREALIRKGSLIVIDIHSALSDLTDTDTWLGLPAAKYTADGTHPGMWGAMRMGRLLANALDQRLPPMDVWPSGTASTYATTDQNILANAGLTGTAGTASNGATGSVADSWTVSSQSGGAFAGTVACSKVAATDWKGDWQRIAISGSASDPQFFQNVTTNLVAGGVYRMGMELRSSDYQPNGGAGALRLRLGERSGGTSAFAQGLDVTSTDETLGFASDLNIGQGIALTPPITTRTGVDRIQPCLLLRGTGTVDVRRPFVIRVG